MNRTNDWKWLPAISAEEFAEHIEEDDFFLKYGNPARIFTKDGHEYLCIAIELYERLFGKVEIPDDTLKNGDEKE